MGEVVARRSHDDRNTRCGIPDRISNSAVSYGPSSTLQKIMDSREYFYHEVQQTERMLEDSRRRARLSRELQRRSEMERLRRKGISYDNIVPTPVLVDQFLVTLTLHVNRPELYELTNPIGSGSKLDNIASISVATDTIIRLPDKGENDPFLSTQLTISGRLANVEKARLRVRDCGLIDVMFPLINVRPEVPMGSRDEICHFLLRKELLRFIPAHLRVHIMERNCLFMSYIVRIVGRVTDEQIINETVPKLLNIFYAPEALDKVPLATQVDIPACHRYLVFGHGDAVNNNLLAIAKITNTSILFPAALYGESPVFSCFIIGELDVLQKTRMYLQGLLPTQLSFTIRDEDLKYKRETDNTYKHFDQHSQVFLRVQPSELQPLVRRKHDPLIHYFCLSTREYNTNKMYSVVDLTVRGSDSSKIPVPPTNTMFHQLIQLLSDPSLFLDYKGRTDPKLLHLPPSRHDIQTTEDLLRNDTPVPVDPISKNQTVTEPVESCNVSQSYDVVNGRQRQEKIEEPVYPVYPTYSRGRVHNNDLRYFNNQFNGPKSFRTFNNARLRPNEKRNAYTINKGSNRFPVYTPSKSELPLKLKLKQDDEEVFYALNDSDISSVNQSVDGDKCKRTRNSVEDSNIVGRYITQPTRLPVRRENHYEAKIQLRHRTPIPSQDDVSKKLLPEVPTQFGDPPMSPSGDTSRRMNVMELIMKASEEPQSVARNREMKESNDDDLEEKAHRTYAEILEGKGMEHSFQMDGHSCARESCEQWDYV